MSCFKPFLNGIDGKVAAGQLPKEVCCPPSLCNIDICGLICNFIQMLPSGPLWDRPKAERLTWHQNNSRQDPCAILDCKGFGCASIVDHAIYTAKALYLTIMDALLPAIRESDPYTAYDTQDDWLKKLGWRDCFEATCRDETLGPLLPNEIMGSNGPVQCKLDYDPALVMAVKRGIIIALSRLNLGTIKNLDGINFAIAELGAELIASHTTSEPFPSRDCGCANEDPCPHYNPGPCQEGLPPGTPDPCCRQNEKIHLTICNVGDVLRKPSRDACAATCCDTSSGFGEPCETVQAYWQAGCNSPAGLPDKVWPGVLAAECIVRSLLPRDGRFVIARCC